MEALKKKKNVGVTKVKAAKLIEELIERCEIANSLPKEEIAHKVKRLIVFGSYLSDKEKLGDLDIFIELESKWEELSEELDFFSDKRPYNGLRYFENSKVITKMFLKNKKKSYSLHDFWEFERMSKENPDFKYKEIFNIEKEVTV